MKTINAFVEDPGVIRTMSDDKIRLLARKLQSRARRSPNRSAYNTYVREQMARLKESERSGERSPTSAVDKFRWIGRQWTDHDNPHRCASVVKTAWKEKLCPQCPDDDQHDDAWRRVRWARPSGVQTPPSASPSSGPSQVHISSPTSTLASETATASESPRRPMRCPGDMPVYCKRRTQNRGWCVKAPSDCHVPVDLLNYTRTRCSDAGTQDECVP
jgi:hypothetical protein